MRTRFDFDTLKIVKTFEKFIILSLVFLMGLVVLFSTYELLIHIIKELILAVKTPTLLLEKYELMKIFGLFFNVLIGLELFETVHLYLKDDIIHAEYVLLVGLTAIARKIIIIDYKEYTSEYILMLAALITSLSLGFYLIRRAQVLRKDLPGKTDENSTGESVSG